MRDEGKFLAGQQVYNQAKDYRRATQSSARFKKQPLSGHRWLLKLSCAILIACAAIWLWQKITNPQVLPIRTIQITGSYSHVDQNVLRQAILPYANSGFLWLDADGLQDRLQQVAWVYSARVKRTWPDKISINLVEQKPVARIGSDSLVNEQGDIFEVDKATIPAGLPLFITASPGQQKQILQNYQTIEALFAPLKLSITAIAVDARESWVLQLSNGIVIIMGKVEPLKRLQRFAGIYSQVVAGNAAAINSIDLRYTSGVAVRFKNSAGVSR